MNLLRSAWTIACKDLRCYFRDRTGVLLGFLLPIALVTVMGFVMQFAFGGSGGMPKVNLVVLDHDQTPSSQKFVEELRTSKMLDVELRPPEETEEQARQLVADGEQHHVLVLQAGYEKAVQGNETPPILMFRDPGRSNEGQMIQVALMQASMATSNGKMWVAGLRESLKESGVDPGQVTQIITAADQFSSLIAGAISMQLDGAGPQGQAAGNGEKTKADPPTKDDSGQGKNDPETKDSGDDSAKQRSPMLMDDFMGQMVPVKKVDIAPPDRPKNLSHQIAQSIAGMVVMMLMFGVMACGTMLLLEREQGTLRRLLMSSIPRESILWGKFLFAVVVAIIQLVVLILYSEAVFRVHSFRDPITLIVLCVTWAAAATSFGMLIASWAKTNKQAEGISTLLILVLAALGGCWFPIQIASLPMFAEIVTKCTITYWAMSGFQGMYWHLHSWTHPSMLLAIGVQWIFVFVAAGASLYFFRKRYLAM